MPGSYLAELFKILRQGQLNCKASDPVFLDNDGPVMPSRVGIKDALKEGLAELPAQLNASIDMPLDGLAARQDDKGADFLLGKIRQGPHDNVHSLGLNGVGILSSQAPQGDPLENLS